MASKKNKKISAYLKEKLQHAFNVFDTDHSGALSLDELREVFQRPGGGCPLSDEQVQELFHEFDVNHDGVLEFDEFAAFWTGTLGEAGDDLLYMASKEKKKPAKAGPGVAPAPAKPAVKSASLITRRGKATKTFTLESKTNLDMRLQAELTKQQKYKANAESTSSLTFERKLGAALIRNDKSNVLKAGKLDKYLATLLRSWDKNGDNAISIAEFRLAVRNQPIGLKADNNEIDTLFKAFDADASGSLNLKEMMPFLKALQKAALAAEEETKSLNALADASHETANALREAAATMGMVERMRADLDGGSQPLPIKFLEMLQSRAPKDKVKLEEAPVKVFQLEPKNVGRTAEISRAAFRKGVLAGLGEKEGKTVESERLVDSIHEWFDASLTKQGLSPEHNAKAKLDLRQTLAEAQAEKNALDRANKEKLAELEVVERQAMEQQKAMAAKQAEEDKQAVVAEEKSKVKAVADQAAADEKEAKKPYTTQIM